MLKRKKIVSKIITAITSSLCASAVTLTQCLQTKPGLQYGPNCRSTRRIVPYTIFLIEKTEMIEIKRT